MMSQQFELDKTERIDSSTQTTPVTFIHEVLAKGQHKPSIFAKQSMGCQTNCQVIVNS
jgi:hypothetical protein